MAESFESILDRPVSQTERPKPVPVGTYACVVKGLPRQDKSSKKGTEFVEFTLQILQAGDDVDEEALAEIPNLQARTLRVTFYLTEDSVWRLKKFLVNDLQIEDEDDDKSYAQMIAEAPGRQCLVTVKHQASDDGQTVYANVSGTAAIS